MDQLIIKKNDLSIEFRQTAEQYDPEPNVRAYCVQHPDYFNVQIRARVPLRTTESGRTPNISRNLIASAYLTRDEILQLAEYVKNYK